MSPTAEPVRRPGRPRSEAKYTAILGAAAELFLADGYTRTSMDGIAKRAGVSKQTVYGHFADKAALFSAVVAEARSGDESALGRLPETPGSHLPAIRAELSAFLDKNLQIALSPKVSALRRLMISEIAHHRELRWFWTEGAPQVARARLAAYLATADAAQLLRVEDPDETAGQMIALSGSEGQLASRYGTATFTAADRKAIVDRTIRLFLRALAP
ncbi:TetR/AcrR family transcriptional regulator [Nakamurella lactea]|uniref:TetR/AcrR family transcriptional regulator n=1 Tax=Nakamurella lactea TaxID=459515 RepID=UPI000426586F|nr:TetR/AcrR family transcriptional regulator [Nakamurella lactea]